MRNAPAGRHLQSAWRVRPCRYFVVLRAQVAPRATPSATSPSAGASPPSPGSKRSPRRPSSHDGLGASLVCSAAARRPRPGRTEHGGAGFLLGLDAELTCFSRSSPPAGCASNAHRGACASSLGSIFGLSHGPNVKLPVLLASTLRRPHAPHDRPAAALRPHCDTAGSAPRTSARRARYAHSDSASFAIVGLVAAAGEPGRRCAPASRLPRRPGHGRAQGHARPLPRPSCLSTSVGRIGLDQADAQLLSCRHFHAQLNDGPARRR